MATSSSCVGSPTCVCTSSSSSVSSELVHKTESGLWTSAESSRVRTMSSESGWLEETALVLGGDGGGGVGSWGGGVGASCVGGGRMWVGSVFLFFFLFKPGILSTVFGMLLGALGAV